MPLPASSAASSFAHSAASSFVITISPLSNPSSTRDMSSSIDCSFELHVFDQHAGNAGRMDERNLEPEETGVGLLVDQLGAGGGGVVERRADVVDTEGDVMHPGPTAGHEAADGRVGAERPEELDAGAPDTQRNRLDSLRGHRLAVLRHGAEKPFVRVDGG